METAHGLLDLLGHASGTCEPDLVVGLLQEVRHTRSLMGTALATVELIEQPLLEDDDIVNTIPALRRKLVVVERLYTMRVIGERTAAHADESGEVAQRPGAFSLGTARPDRFTGCRSSRSTTTPRATSSTTRASSPGAVSRCGRWAAETPTFSGACSRARTTRSRSWPKQLQPR